MRYRVWYKFHLPTGMVRFEDHGVVEEAATAEKALEQAHSRGCSSGLGFLRDYINAVALPEGELPDGVIVRPKV